MLGYCLNDTRRNLAVWWFISSGGIFVMSSLKYLTYARSASEYLILR